MYSIFYETRGFLRHLNAYFYCVNFNNKLIDNAVDEISKLPGIGKRSALRVALHLLRQPKIQTRGLSQSLLELREKVQYCHRCFNISEKPTCGICLSHFRDVTTICVVENIEDVMAVENTAQFKGLYHVLGGVISPVLGIAIDDLTIVQLIGRVYKQNIKELIFALSSTVEADSTAYYIYKQLKSSNLKISTLARGIPLGDELEYTDELTLGRSIVARIPFEKSFKVH